MWPTQEEIQRTNERVTILMNQVNQRVNLQLLFDEAMNINPNHTSGEYATQLNDLKLFLFTTMSLYEEN